MELKNIKKNFGRKNVLSSINLNIDKGIYGLLGANGAGKSTLMKVMIGELPVNMGEVIYDVNTKDEFYSTLGYLPQKFNAPKDMTVKEYLTYISIYKGLTDSESKEIIKVLSKELNLDSSLDKKVGSLSGGTLQRVGILQAFINDPKFIVLDEPSSGLDISERRNLKNFISKEAKGKYILISTHIISDIEYIVDWVLVMKSGKILKQIKYEDALSQLSGMVWEICLEDNELELFKNKLESLDGVITNINMEDSKKTYIRYVCMEPVTKKAISMEPVLNDYYLWIVER